MVPTSRCASYRASVIYILVAWAAVTQKASLSHVLSGKGFRVIIYPFIFLVFAGLRMWWLHAARASRPYSWDPYDLHHGCKARACSDGFDDI